MKTSLEILTLLLIGFSLVTGCTRKEDEFEYYVQYPIKSNIKDLDPVLSSDFYSSTVMSHVYDTLVQYAYLERPIKVEPLLAEAMPQISKDQLTYTFKIRKGIMFHDDPCFKATGGKGRELVAEDFILSFKRLADPKLRSDQFWIFEKKVKGFVEWRDEAAKTGTADYTKPVPGLAAPDKYTLKIFLNKPDPQLLYKLTMVPASAVPFECAQFYGPEFQGHPVGTGPYKFRSWVRNSKIVLDRNPNYYDDRYPRKGEATDQALGRLADAGQKLPLNDGVIFTEVVEDQTRWLNFQKGAFDLVEPPKDNFDSAVVNGKISDELAKKGVGINTEVDADLTFEAFNMEDPIVGGNGKGKLIRQAIALAMDTDALIDRFYRNRAIPAQGPIPPGLYDYDAKRKHPYKIHNLEKAKELLKRAGYPNGEGLPELVYDTYSGTTQRQFAEFYQQQVSQLGIKMRINVNTWPQYLEKQQTKKAQMFGNAWAADYPDAEDFLQLFYGPNESPGNNSANYKNPEYDKLYEKASVMPEGPARHAVYNKMVDIVNEDVPWMVQVHRLGVWVQHGWLKNFKHNLIILNKVKYFKIDKQTKADLKKKL